MPLVYMITTKFIGDKHYIFGLNEQSKPVSLCVINHKTYLYARSRLAHDARKRDAEDELFVLQKQIIEAGIAILESSSRKLFPAEKYHHNALWHHKIYVNGYNTLQKLAAFLQKNGFAVGKLLNEEAKLMSDLGLKPCQWIEYKEEDVAHCDLGNSDSIRDPIQLVIQASSIKNPLPKELSKEATEDERKAYEALPTTGRAREIAKKTPPRALVMTFDLETYSSRHGIEGSTSMPSSRNEADIVYCLSMVFSWSDSKEVYKSFCICVHGGEIVLPDKKILRPDGTVKTEKRGEIISVGSEEELFNTFVQIVNREDPDCITGYNIFGYDFPYIKSRTAHNPLPTYGRLRYTQDTIELRDEHGQTKGYPIKIGIADEEQYEDKDWEGAGGQWHSYHYPVCYGRVLIDTFLLVKGTKTSPGTPGTLQSHKLNDVGLHFLPEKDKEGNITNMEEMETMKKEDLSYAETFKLYREGTTEGIAKICSYCIQDSVLCMKVFHKVKGWIQVRESASIFLQDSTEVLTTGQTKKSFTQFLRKAEEMGFHFSPDDNNRNLKVQGAFVNDPKRGRHTDVLTMDFASMYPMTMIRWNICPSTFAQPRKDMKTGQMKLPDGLKPEDCWTDTIPIEVDPKELPPAYENVEGLDGEEFDKDRVADDDYLRQIAEANDIPPKKWGDYMEMLRKKYGTESKGIYENLVVNFVQNRKGIYPTILQELADTRKEYKKLKEEAKKEGRTIDAEMYDQRQNLVKVVMNSMYGCFGAKKGAMSFPEAAISITSRGRYLIKLVNDYIEARGCNIIYNDTDSVMFQLPEPTEENLRNPLIAPFAYQGQYIFRNEDGLAILNTDGTTKTRNRKMGDPVDMKVIEIGEKLTDEINTRILQKPMKIEFERVADMLFLEKKRYMGFKVWYEGKIDYGNFAKGVIAVRGDTVPFVRNFYSEIVKEVLGNKTFNYILRRCKDTINALNNGVLAPPPPKEDEQGEPITETPNPDTPPPEKLPNRLLSVSKMLAHHYVSPKAPMKVFAEYLHRNGENAEPGSKIPMIVIKGNTKTKSERYRSPETTADIDYEHYAEQAKKPLIQLLRAAFPAQSIALEL